MSLTIDVKVIPSSGRAQCVLDKSGQLKCYLKSSPEKGKANRELLSLFAKALDIAQNKIEIIAGATSRKKRIKINTELSLKQIHNALGIVTQMNLF